MPSIDFASGLIGSYFTTLAKRQHEKQTNSLAAAKFLMETGRVQDFEDLRPYLDPLMQDPGGLGKIRKGGSTSGGGGKGKGGMNAQSLLAALVNPMLKDHAANGQKRLLMSEDEFQQRQSKVADEAEARKLKTFGEEERLRHQSDVELEGIREKGRKDVAEITAKGKRGIETAAGQIDAATDVFRERNQREPTREEQLKIAEDALATFRGLGKDTPWRNLTGKPKEALEEALIAKGVSPSTATKEQVAEALPRVERLLASRRQLDDANKRALFNLRQFMLGADISGGGGGGGAVSSPAPTAPASGTPRATTASPTAKEAPKTGPEVLKGLPTSVASEVKAFAEYRRPVSAYMMRTPRWEKLQGLIEAYTGETFDLTKYQMRQRARIDFTSGKESNNIKSLRTAVKHLDTFANKARVLNNAPVQLWNRIANVGLEQSGDPRVDGFLEAATALSGELATVFKGTSGTDTEIKAWRTRLNAAKSPEQFKELVRTGTELLRGRVAAMQQKWHDSMGNAPFEFLSPDDEKIISGATRADGEAGRRLKAKGLLESKGLAADDANVKKFLANNPTFK